MAAQMAFHHMQAKLCWRQGEREKIQSRVLLFLSSPWYCVCMDCAPHGLGLSLFFFFFSSTTSLLPTHLPLPSCTHAQSCNPMDISPPDSSVHGLFQARILEWVAISFSRTFSFYCVSPSLGHHECCPVSKWLNPLVRLLERPSGPV